MDLQTTNHVVFIAIQKQKSKTRDQVLQLSAELLTLKTTTQQILRLI